MNSQHAFISIAFQPPQHQLHNNFNQCPHIETDASGGPRGLGLPGSFFFFFRFQLLYISFLQLGLPYKTLDPFSSISLASLIQIATIQPNNLTKTMKIFTMVIVFQQKKKKNIYIYIYILPPKNQKNHVLLEKLKLNFLQLHSIGITIANY